MKNKAVKEFQHFFNEDQKAVKGKIMEHLMGGLFKTLFENKELFQTEQSLVDLFGSILVMFNRDVITHMLINLGLTDQGSKIMRNLFDTIRSQVVERINLAKN